MWYSDGVPVSPYVFKVVVPSDGYNHKLNIKQDAIGRSNSQFSGVDQQDAQEFLTTLLDLLHEDVKIRLPRGFVVDPEDDDDGTVEDEKAKEWSWHKFEERNASFVSKSFMGQLRSVLRCGVCGKVNIIWQSAPIGKELMRKIMYRFPGHSQLSQCYHFLFHNHLVVVAMWTSETALIALPTLKF